MKKKLFLILVLLFLFLSIKQFAFAQAELGFSEQIKGFFLDNAAFKDKPDSSRLEIYYLVFNDFLTFLKVGEKYKSQYEIELTIFNRENKQVTASSIEKEYWLNSYKESINPKGYIINQSNLYLPSGHYKLRARLIDKNSSNQAKLEKDFIVPPWGEKELEFSDIEFCRLIEEVKDSSQFSKQGNSFIPSVSLIFGEETPELCIYYELYPGDEKIKEVLALFLVKDPENQKVKEESTWVSLNSSRVSQVKKFSVQTLPVGKYNLEIKWQDKKGKVLAKTQKQFEMRWSVLNQVKLNYEKMVDVLRYVASDKERDALKKTKPEERVQKWQEFWKSKDPTPDTPENELEKEYFKRIEFANENFGIFDKEGWQTDLGMVYIKYGKPDEIDKHPFERETKPYQTWYYYRLNKEFIFIDETGYGDYELQYPYDGRVD
jgi:GWxTD domain-containing protein